MMTKNQKVWVNIILFLGAYLLPIYILSTNQDNYLYLEKVQVSLLLVLFAGAILLTILNYRNIKLIKEWKWLWIGFEVVGVLGVVYSASLLYIIYGFSHFGF